MNQKKVDVPVSQVMVNGIWVDKEKFRSLVYGYNGKTLLCNTYPEYYKAIQSKEWFDDIPVAETIEAEAEPVVSTVKGKKQHDTNS